MISKRTAGKHDNASGGTPTFQHSVCVSGPSRWKVSAQVGATAYKSEGARAIEPLSNILWCQLLLRPKLGAKESAAGQLVSQSFAKVLTLSTFRGASRLCRGEGARKEARPIRASKTPTQSVRPPGSSKCGDFPLRGGTLPLRNKSQLGSSPRMFRSLHFELAVHWYIMPGV